MCPAHHPSASILHRNGNEDYGKGGHRQLALSGVASTSAHERTARTRPFLHRLSSHGATLSPHGHLGPERMEMESPVCSSQSRAFYTVGVRHVCHTEGACKFLGRLDQNHELRKQRKRVRHVKNVSAWLCDSVTGVACPMGDQCSGIHVTPGGHRTLRGWITPGHQDSS